MKTAKGCRSNIYFYQPCAFCVEHRTWDILCWKAIAFVTFQQISNSPHDIFYLSVRPPFKYPATNVNKYGKLFGYMDFSFNYTVPNNNKMGSLSCGYGVGNFIARKRTTQPATIQGGFVGRADIITDITGSSLTFRLKNLKYGDAKPLYCLLVYDGLPYPSRRYNLNIYGKYNVFMFFVINLHPSKGMITFFCV